MDRSGTFLSMVMMKSEKEACEDIEDCQAILAEGKCAKEKYSKICRNTCGLCGPCKDKIATENCKKLKWEGRCKDEKIWEMCMYTCKKCKPGTDHCN